MNIRALRTAAAVTGVLAAVSLTTTSALAVPPPNGSTNVLALAGSDTIQDVDTAIAAKYNASAANPTPRDKAVNIPAFSTAATTVPADAFCPARNYATVPAAGQLQAPNGSTAGSLPRQTWVMNLWPYVEQTALAGKNDLKVNFYQAPATVGNTMNGLCGTRVPLYY